ncbi:TIGR00366 family protein [Streptococcus phocae subsp. phocae]|uniref:Short-chain fatty acid transporter n=2 Tax=Streptococcus phocae TaxID=119224 RepID=A0A0P6S1P0_9STRE|nr:short-chain fatty acid transporter [Streptococcus phocae]KPJ22404.1 short-chain fatty acid transporter [Streptococcus phocae]
MKDIKNKKSFMDRYIDGFMKWMPESLFICFILTFLVIGMAVFMTDTPFIGTEKTGGIIYGWVNGFWGLLSFAMQMTILLATGNAVASSPPAHKMFKFLAKLPKSRTQIFIFSIIVGSIFGFLHWGLGMMVAIVFGKELLVQARQKGIKVHTPLFVATLFFTFLPATSGLSGAAVLYSATPNYLRNSVAEAYKQLVPESVPLTSSVLNVHFISLLIVCMLVPLCFALFVHPKDESKIVELDDDIYMNSINGTAHIEISRNTPAEKMNSSRLVMYIIGSAIFGYSVYQFSIVGLSGLDLNSFNFLFLGLGLLLCGQQGPEYYAALFKDGVMSSWGLVLQFPFYAGIFGIIQSTGLGLEISHFFVSISNGTTWPVFAYLYSALLNIAVPSGGSKFVIEAPYIVPASIEVGNDLGRILQAYQLGDATTNLIVPFWALSYLSNFKLKFNQIVAYTIPCVLVVSGIVIVYLLAF